MKVLSKLALVAVVALPLAIVAQQAPPPRGATGGAGAAAGQAPPRGAPAPAPPCVPGGQFICGQTAPEDLVVVPGGEWVVAGMYARPGGIQIINTKDRTSVKAYPTDNAKEELDKKTYDTCPGPPNAAEKAAFQTHGVALKPGTNGVHTLYVVAHPPTREAIEVFQLDAKVKPPTLKWVGCAIAPEPIGLNSVLPLPDGGFIGTDFLERGPNAGTARGRLNAGEVNGSLYEWHTGKSWRIIPGTATSGANGLELAKDGKTLFVAAWGDRTFYRITLGQPAAKRETVKLNFRPDNVRWSADGSLLVTGQGDQAQPQTSNVVKVDPKTMKVTEVLTRPNTPEFGAGTVAVEVGKDLWIGSFRGDRILIAPAAK
jgi:hypothetical protein